MTFDEIFQEGVKSFQAKEFEKASTFFTQALDLQPENTTVLVNLALSEFQTGQKSASYAHFKKALHLDPYFTAAQQGFNFVKSQIQIREIPHRIETYERARAFLIEPLSITLPLALSAVLFIIWGFRSFKFLGNKKRSYLAGEDPATYGVLNLLLSVVFILSLFWVVFFKYDSQIQRGIIKLDSVSIRSAPMVSSPEVLQIFGGLEVQILRKEANWVQIEYPGSIAGWVEASSLVEL